MKLKEKSCQNSENKQTFGLREKLKLMKNLVKTLKINKSLILLEKFRVRLFGRLELIKGQVS